MRNNKLLREINAKVAVEPIASKVNDIQVLHKILTG